MITTSVSQDDPNYGAIGQGRAARPQGFREVWLFRKAWDRLRAHYSSLFEDEGLEVVGSATRDTEVDSSESWSSDVDQKDLAEEEDIENR